MRSSLIERILEEVAVTDKKSIWKRMELIGDIVLLKAPYKDPIDLDLYKIIGEKIIEKLPYVKSVWLAISPVKGEYRVRDRLVHLAGEKRTTTIYKEHGCVFKVDIAKVFITPRLSYEHIRVAKLVSPGETIINMFSGAGLFSIIIAKHARPRKVYSIDINEYAVQLIRENAKLNKIEDIVIPLHGDAAIIVNELFRNSADRILMPLPELALEYLGYAIDAIREKGIVHVYLHINWVKGEDPRDIARSLVSERLDQYESLEYKIQYVRRVRPVGPRFDQVVVDVQITK